MDFPFDVSSILPRQICFVDNTLIIKDWDSSTSKNRDEYQHIYKIIDLIGEASSFAQGLNRIITTADKLQNSDHYLYLMTEFDQNIGRTLVVGMLKIGRKKLFILDHAQKTHEVAPLCVLDFYIHESRQRRGYGRVLFDYMLKHQDVDPGHMAIDKPSEKFLCFYERHYDLLKQITQINNFAIFVDFFIDRPVFAQEAAMTKVTRSNRSSRNASPESSSPVGSRKGSHSNIRQQFAGKPSRQRDTNMSDILQGKAEGFIPSVRCGTSKPQTTLDWMRAGTESQTRRPYSASRTSSYSGSPVCRTPRAVTPPMSHPGTPPRVAYARDGSRPVYTDGTGSPTEGSVAPTPATSPHSRHDEQNGRDEADDTTTVVSQVENLTLVQQPKGKTGNWRDGISRSTDGLVDRMTTKGTTMTGVLRDNDSVHGHLKFHHHALW